MSPSGVHPFMRRPGVSDVRRVPVKVLVPEASHWHYIISLGSCEGTSNQPRSASVVRVIS